MRRGEQLNGFKSIVSAVHMTNPAAKTFLLTHAPLVGHELKASPKDVDVLKDFVNWVNNDRIGKSVEAVFCGHTHLSGGYKCINELNMDMKDFNLDTENIPFTWPIVYIETTTACKKYTHR